MAILSVQPDTRTATLRGTSIPLTQRELEALQWMLERPGALVTRREFEREVWGFRAGVRSEAVPVAIRRLRAKIGADLIETIRGAGWRLIVPESPASKLPDFGTSWFPRPAEEARIATLLEGRRVVTIVGPGGMGKTRLAHQAAQAHNIIWVELGALSSEEQIRDALVTAASMRSSEWEVVETSLRAADRLVVLDEAEGIVAATAAIVQRFPGQRFLITSRVPLAVPGEAVFEVPPLDGADGRRFMQERLAGARWGGTPDPAIVDRALVALDGLPLAMELAAAHPQPLEEILAGLENDRLFGGREGAQLTQTLQTSVERLTPQARDVLCALSLCAGSVDRAFLEHWLGVDAPDRVRDLADQSLVVWDRGWRLLRILRVFVHGLSAPWPTLHHNLDMALIPWVEGWEVLLRPKHCRERVGPYTHELEAAMARVEPDASARIAIALAELYELEGLPQQANRIVREAKVLAPGDAWLTAWTGEQSDLSPPNADPVVRVITDWRTCHKGGATPEQRRATLRALPQSEAPWMLGNTALVRCLRHHKEHIEDDVWDAHYRALARYPTLQAGILHARSMQQSDLGLHAEALLWLDRAATMKEKSGDHSRGSTIRFTASQLRFLLEPTTGFQELNQRAIELHRQGDPEGCMLVTLIAAMTNDQPIAFEHLERLGPSPAADAMTRFLKHGVIPPPTLIFPASRRSVLIHRLWCLWAESVHTASEPTNWRTSFVAALQLERTSLAKKMLIVAMNYKQHGLSLEGIPGPRTE